MSNSDKPRPRLPFPIHTDNVARYHKPQEKMTKRQAIFIAKQEAIDDDWADLLEFIFYDGYDECVDIYHY